MTSDHHHSKGAGMKHSPAPSLPVFAICEVCGEADEQDAMTDGMCRECIGVVREGLRSFREKCEKCEKCEPFNWPFALAVATIASVIVWRWV